VTPSLAEAFHAAFYSFPPPRRPTLPASLVCLPLGWFHHSGLSYRSVHPLDGSITLDGRTDMIRTLRTSWGTQAIDYSWANLDVIPYRTNFIRKDSGCRCNLNLNIISPGSRTRDFTVVSRYNYRYAVQAYIKLDETLHGGMVVNPTNDREIPGSIPGRYNLQIEITSKSWSGEPETPSLVEAFHVAFYSFPPTPSAHATGLIGLSTPWMTPSLSMVVQICSPLGSLHHSGWSYRYDPDAQYFVVYPGHWLLLGNLDVIPYRTNFIRKISGCWCNLNLKIISPGSRTRDFTVFGRYNYCYAVEGLIKLDVSKKKKTQKEMP